MKPNNLYYRDILKILEPSQEYAKFYSTMYYLRRIAMHYGASYTGRKCSNKYIKDWAIAMGVTDDGQHHVNYYWIKRIAKKLVPSTADDLSENTYLRIISENISHQLSIKTFINNVEVDNTQTIPPTILSYADRENAVFKFVVTDEEDNPFQGYSIPFSVGGVDQTPMTTNANGEATYTYESSGVGDTDVSINCSLVSKRYDIEDCVKAHIGTYLDQYSSGSSTTAPFNDVLDSTFNIEFDMLVTQSNNNSCFFRVGETDSKALLVGKVGSGDSVWKIYARNGTDIITTGSSIPIGNDWIPITLSFDGTTFKFNNDISITNLNGISLTKLLNAISYKEGTSSGQIRNIKIKPL